MTRSDSPHCGRSGLQNEWTHRCVLPSWEYSLGREAGRPRTTGEELGFAHCCLDSRHLAQTTLLEVGRLHLRDVAGSGHQGYLETWSWVGGGGKEYFQHRDRHWGRPWEQMGPPPPTPTGSWSTKKPEVSLERLQEPPPGGPRVGLYPQGSGKPLKSL